MGRDRSLVSDDAIENYIRNSPDPGFVVQEIADEFDITKETARNRLERLVEEGRINRKKPTKRAVFYYVDLPYRQSA